MLSVREIFSYLIFMNIPHNEVSILVYFIYVLVSGEGVISILLSI